MTLTADHYVARVLDNLPRSTPLRDQIALELRGLIADRLAGGQPLEAVIHQLGDARALAESYLREVPLKPAPHPARLWAKAFDIALVVVVVAMPALVGAILLPPEFRPFILLGALFAGSLGFIAYAVATEAADGRTLGKRLAGLLVVRESGAPISVGQAIVRNLPIVLQFYWIDVLFALFTEHRQRAFELLSKTRVVMDPGRAEPPRA